MSELRAYHGNPAIKAKYLARVRAHRKADRLIQGTGWEDGKGCAVGCTLESYDHMLYEDELGIPVVLAYLEDRIFEGLNAPTSQRWPERFLAAIKPGADLSSVKDWFLLWLLSGAVSPIAKWTGSAPIQAVADLYRRRLDGDEPTDAEWHAAARVAEWDAARAASDAARAAARAGARAAHSAAGAAYSAAGAASDAEWAASDAEWSAAWASAWLTMSNKLEQLLQEAPVRLEESA